MEPDVILITPPLQVGDGKGQTGSEQGPLTLAEKLGWGLGAGRWAPPLALPPAPLRVDVGTSSRGREGLLPANCRAAWAETSSPRTGV